MTKHDPASDVRNTRHSVSQVTYKTPVPMAGVFSCFHTLFARKTLYLPRHLGLL
jgi:hypothetical protein